MPRATAARALEHPELGALSADEVRRSALLQLAHMGATVTSERAWRASAITQAQ